MEQKNKVVEHEAFGKYELKDPLYYPDLEKYAEKIITYDTANHSRVHSYRATIESATEAGILLTPVDLKTVHPSFPAWLSTQIAEHIDEAYDLPKN